MSLDEAGRRELVRLIVEDGLTPSQAAARFNVPESLAKRWHARALAGAESLGRPTAPAPAPAPARMPAPQRGQRPSLRPAGSGEGRSSPSAGRRRLAGIGLVLAFVPVGWVVSAAALEGTDAIVPGVRTQAPAAPTSARFDPSQALGRNRGRLVAVARRAAIRVHERPGGRVKRRLRERRIEGQRVPLVFLVNRRRDGWARVHLPVRPNGSKGWIRLRHVQLQRNPYRIRIDLRQRRMLLFRDGRFAAKRRIGVGRSLSPTPRGTYFVTDLIKARDPNDVYGPYAFGLSAYSPVLTSFRGGNGQIGLHGTNDPTGLGRQVSAGCIRVDNATIRSLARRLPLGTPVVIRR